MLIAGVGQYKVPAGITPVLCALALCARYEETWPGDTIYPQRGVHQTGAPQRMSVAVILVASRGDVRR